MGENSALKAGLWDKETQRNIDALSHLCQPGIEIEAHVIEAKNYFGNKISYPEITEVFKACCKDRSDQTKQAFTNAFYNRLGIRLKE